MKKSFRQTLGQAGEYCNKCYLYNAFREEGCEKAEFNKDLAKSSLAGIIKYSEGAEIRRIVEEALTKCRECWESGFENPEIFRYLDEKRLVDA